MAQRVSADCLLSQGINEETNPALRNNDVIVVRQSGSASFADAVSGIFLVPWGQFYCPFLYCLILLMVFLRILR